MIGRAGACVLCGQAFADQRARLTDEARRRVPSLPVHDEHWCCYWTETPGALPAPLGAQGVGGGGSGGSESGSSGGRRGGGGGGGGAPLYVVTVAVLSGQRVGAVVGSEQAVRGILTLRCPARKLWSFFCAAFVSP